MPGAARLHLLCHAATPATRRAAFPAADEPADPAALPRPALLPALLPDCAAPARVLSSPAPCALSTASVLGLAAIPDPVLRDLDPGAWRGRTLPELAAADPQAVSRFLDDPDFAFPGGESLSGLRTRIAAWMTALPPGPTLAVTHPAVMRAALLHALGAPPAAARRLDIPPLCTATLFRSAPGAPWVLRALRPPP